MKNTTFRKKALLSSVAMLLVALVALGSATFAWFAANPYADAQGLAFKTTASSGLVIKTETHPVWGHTAYLNAMVTSEEGAETKTYGPDKTILDLQPVTQNQADGTMTTIAAADSKSWENSKAQGVTLAAAPDESFFAEDVFFRLSDGSAAEDDAKIQLTGVTITAATGNPSMLSAIRVAIAGPDGKVLGTYATSIAGANGVLTAVDGTTADFTLLQAANGVKDLDCGITGLSTAEDATKKVTVYVYLDGQDSACYSDNVGSVNAAQIISDVKVDFKLVA